MNMDIIKAVALSRGYTDSAVGSIQIGISKIEADGQNLVFTLADGSTATVSLPIPESGVGISAVSLNEDYDLIISLSDGTELNAGNLPIKTLNDDVADTKSEISTIKDLLAIADENGNTDSSFKSVITTSDKLNKVDIKYGQLIFTTDTKDLYLDTTERILFNQSFIPFETEALRLSYPYPFNAFYFVKDTGILWRYQDGLWIQLTNNSEEQIIFDEFKNFPKVGQENKLYVDKLAIYRWYDGEYVDMTVSLWEQM